MKYEGIRELFITTSIRFLIEKDKCPVDTLLEEFPEYSEMILETARKVRDLQIADISPQEDDEALYTDSEKNHDSGREAT